VCCVTCLLPPGLNIWNLDSGMLEPERTLLKPTHQLPTLPSASSLLGRHLPTPTHGIVFCHPPLYCTPILNFIRSITNDLMSSYPLIPTHTATNLVPQPNQHGIPILMVSCQTLTGAPSRTDRTRERHLTDGHLVT